MTRGESLHKKSKCKHRYSSPMSIGGGSDLKGEESKLKLHDLCEKSKCKCQKRIFFTLKQYQLEGTGFERNYKIDIKEPKDLGRIF